MADLNKDAGKALSDYSDLTTKGRDIALDTIENINKWYESKLEEITEGEVPETRLETKSNVENDDEKIETKIEQISTIQTSNKNKIEQKNNNINKIQTKSKPKIKTKSEIKNEANIKNEELKVEDKIATKIKMKKSISTKISSSIKGIKTLNKISNKTIKVGKNINTAVNSEGGMYKSFEKGISNIAKKPINKISKKITKPIQKKVAKTSINLLTKITKILIKAIASAMKLILSLIPSISPVIIILIVVIAFFSFFGLSMNEETKNGYEQYMINTQNEYDQITIPFYQAGNIVEGTIEGKGMIDWKASMSIIQMLNAELTFDDAEKELLEKFKSANLFEKIEEVTYTYEKEIEEKDEKGNVTKKTQTITETKKIVTNSTLESYIEWCNNNFDVINNYKKKKKLSYDSNQTSFTEYEMEQIRTLYKSNRFFELFSDSFKSNYAYANVIIDDEQLQAIYDEFLKNAGTRYLMDHSNLKYDECMDYYDCSSWVIHVLGHTGIKIIPNTRCNRYIQLSLYTNTSSRKKSWRYDIFKRYI